MWILVFTVCSKSALAHGDHQTDFSGWEIFLGVTQGNVTRGVIFVCCTHELSGNWLSPAQTVAASAVQELIIRDLQESAVPLTSSAADGLGRRRTAQRTAVACLMAKLCGLQLSM